MNVRGQLQAEWTKSSRLNQCLLGVYLLALLAGNYYHEMWRDELQAWNIVVYAGSFRELLTNIRYEGHPLAWFLVIWPVSWISADPALLKVTHALLAVATASLVIFRSPFGFLEKCCIVLGYYLLYEYGIIARNYQVELFVGVSICCLWGKLIPNFLRIGWLLLLLFQTNAFGMMVGVAIALAALYEYLETAGDQKSYGKLVGFIGLVAAGLGISMMTLPPGDSSFASEWVFEWRYERFISCIYSLGNGFFPLSPPGSYHFWNNPLVGVGAKGLWLLTIVFAAAAAYSLRDHKSAFLLFCGSLFLILFFSYIKYAGTFRHQGNAAVALLLAGWVLLLKPGGTKRVFRYVFGIFLAGQVIAGWNAYARDLKYPFSMARETARYIAGNYPPDVVISGLYTDVLTGVSGYLQQPFYHLDARKEVAFVVWNKTNWNKDTHWQPDSVIFAKFASYCALQPRAILVTSYRPMRRSEKDWPREGDAFPVPGEEALYVVCVKAFTGAINSDENFYIYELTNNP